MNTDKNTALYEKMAAEQDKLRYSGSVVKTKI